MIFDDGHRISFTHAGITHDVYFEGDGPGVLLLHEIDGMTPAFCRVAMRIADCGFTVFAPLIFGRPNQHISTVRGFFTVLCVRHEFDLFHSEAGSAITPWLRALCVEIDELTGHHGVGVIGMCLTGNVVLSLMVEPSVRVPVLCEPALPFDDKSALGVPKADLDIAVGRSKMTPILAYRFSEDKICPHERFVTLRCMFPPEGLKATEIASGPGSPFDIPADAHPVLTGDYPNQWDPNHPVQHVLDEILSRLRARLDTGRSGTPWREHSCR
jgi:dienelactone hydrolase